MIEVAALRNFFEILALARRTSRASTTRSRIFLASSAFFLSASQSVSAWVVKAVTAVCASWLLRRPLVCPSNCGFSSITEMAPVRPSATSLASSVSPLSFFSRPASKAAWLRTRVSERRRPETWAPPSTVLTTLQKLKTRSSADIVHCSAISIGIPPDVPDKETMPGCATSRLSFSSRT